MTVNELFADKTLRPKERTEKLCQLLDTGDISVNDLMAFADRAKDAEKATCIESLEYMTKKDATAIDVKVLEWVVAQLTAKAPRIKWESARVIGNTIALYPKTAEHVIPGLLDNTTNDGTVVRWSAAYALGEILKLKLPINETLLPALNSIMDQEEKNSIKKIYAAAIKKAKQNESPHSHLWQICRLMRVDLTEVQKRVGTVIRPLEHGYEARPE